MTTGWTIKQCSARCCWLNPEVKFTRKDAIAHYVARWEPLKYVPDWNERSMSWRWRWLKRRHDIQVVKVKITEIEQ